MYNMMQMTGFSVLLISTFGVVRSPQCGKEVASSGTDFMVGVPGTPSYPYYIDVYITTESYADVHIFNPYINLDVQINVDQSMSYSLNKTSIQLTNGTVLKGIAIHANVSISVVVMTYNGVDYDEGFMALPITALGTTYIAASYQPVSSLYSEFLIVSHETVTNVVIQLPLPYNRSIIAKRLLRFESYQFQGPYDVSGTIITSDKPVAVFSGSSGSQIPVGTGDYQYLVEQLIPTNLWSYEYIIPPIYPRSGYVIKIFAAENNTDVTYSNSTHHSTVYIDEVSNVELVFGQEAVIITSNKPINVAQYGYDVDGSFGDPFMVNGQAITQYRPKYAFHTQRRWPKGYNTLAITVPKIDLPGLILNDRHGAFSSFISVPIAYPRDNYINVYLNLTYNTHYTLTHSSNKTFGAVIYGAFEVSTAYGNMLPSTFKDNTDCTTASRPTMTTPSMATPELTTTNDPGPAIVG